jgi:hypothetical protein
MLDLEDKMIGMQYRGAITFLSIIADYKFKGISITDYYPNYNSAKLGKDIIYLSKWYKKNKTKVTYSQLNVKLKSSLFFKFDNGIICYQEPPCFW